MTRGDRLLKIIEKVGDSAYKVQILRDIAILATFNIADLSRYVKDCFEDPSGLRSKGRLM